MFTLMLRCGLRIAEVSALEVSDLILGESPSRMIIRGKGSRERTVYLSSESEPTLQNWLAIRPKVHDEHVFISYQQKKLSTTSINVRVNHVRKVSGVDLTAHRLRHTFADHLLSAGMPITSIQKLMGHRFVETTQNYALANDKQVQADYYKACEKIEGWKLLMEAVQAEGQESEAEAGMDIIQNEDDSSEHEASHIDVAIPARLSHLPVKLVRQLEAYRRLKANHWRQERLAANSLLYYSQQGILWGFLCGTCGVNDVTDLRLEHVMQFVRARLEAVMDFTRAERWF